MGVGSSCKLLLRTPKAFDVDTKLFFDNGKQKIGCTVDVTNVRPFGKVVTVSKAGGGVLSTLPARNTGVHSRSFRFVTSLSPDE